MALASEELGAVESEGFDTDQDPALLGDWDWPLFELEDFGLQVECSVEIQ